MLDISVIILTYNEEKHIERCIKNAKRFANEIFVIDSFSSDNTVVLAENLGAKVFKNKWENNHAKQFNWGLENLPISTEWIFRLDADEYLTENLIDELYSKVPKLDKSISGIVFPRKLFFLGKLINRDGMNMRILRMFRNKIGYCENRWMDEHIVLTNGKSVEFENLFIDHNLNSLGWWICKHDNYAIKEAVELLSLNYGLIKHNDILENGSLADAANIKREQKTKYARLPLFLRAFMYFCLRYIFKLGFLEGKEGFLWHFLQGWWYRTLVDAKIFEIKKACGSNTDKMKMFIKKHYQIDLQN